MRVPAFFIGCRREKVRVCFWDSGFYVKKKMEGENADFYWEFCRFLLFCSGKNVVSLW
jgi:hypothetical protein